MAALGERHWDVMRIEVTAALPVPLLGTVAAGRPIEALPVEGVLDLPGGLWSGRRVFSLRVRGTSMIDEGIRDGDYLIVEPRVTADSGQTVVAEVDGGVTVKRLFREPDGRVRLQPANPDVLPLILAPERVRIVGIVAGIFRRQGFERAPTARTRPRRPPSTDGQTLDLTLRVLEQSVREAEELAGRSGRRGPRLTALARDLRGLRDCYLRTTTPRLREALLREAGAVVRRLRRFGVERR
jgi:repressor LexA